MTMQLLLLSAHSGWRYVVIFIVLLALAKFLIGWLGRAQWQVWDQRLGLAALIAVDIQVLLGLVLWIMSSGWQFGARQAWEHPITMLLVLAAMHVTWRLVQRATEPTHKFRTAFLGYTLAAIILGVGVWRITSG